MMMNTANTAIVQRAFECWNKRDFSGVAELLSDCTYHSPITGDVKGDAYKKLFTSLLNAFPDGKLTVNDLVTEEGKVVVRWNFTGTHKGPLMGIAPTNKRVAMTGMSITRVGGGKIVEAWEEWDNLGMMQQLGIVPMVKLDTKIAA
jgi:steroid delta-isomerase-like uncharacterized protein